MSAYLGRDPLPPADLVATASEERARRREASLAAVKAGQITAEKADWDDIIWSNIVHFMRVLGGDRREPRHWHQDDKDLLARSVRATKQRMLIAYDNSAPGMTRQRIDAMTHVWYAIEFTLLYTKVHPIPVDRRGAAA